MFSGLPTGGLSAATTEGEAMTASIFMDGRLLVGTTWVRPTDWQSDEVELGLLPAMKGASPVELPALGDNQADGDGPRG